MTQATNNVQHANLVQTGYKEKTRRPYWLLLCSTKNRDLSSRKHLLSHCSLRFLLLVIEVQETLLSAVVAHPPQVLICCAIWDTFLLTADFKSDYLVTVVFLSAWTSLAVLLWPLSSKCLKIMEGFYFKNNDQKKHSVIIGNNQKV